MALQNTIYARNREIADLEKRNESLTALAKLGRWVLQMRSDHDCADLDGGDIQDKAIDLGLLVGVEVTKSCGENCNCAGYDAFPLTCFRMSDKAKVLDD